MANRNFHRKQALEREVKDLYLEVSFGATGAPTIVKGLGIASIDRNSAGDYTITLSDQYHGDLKYFNGVLLKSSAEDLYFQVKAVDVVSAKTIRILCLTGASATDPSSGSKAYFKIELKNSTIL
jgi:hypothetical protein